MSSSPGKTHQAIVEAAKEKVGNIKGWEPYFFESVEGGLVINGCLTREKTRGKNKGELKYLKEGEKRVIVTVEDVDRKLLEIGDE